MTAIPDSPRAGPAVSAALATARALLAAGAAPSIPPLAPLHPLPQMALARGRAHEVTGPARLVLAALAAGAALTEGAVLWFRPGWSGNQLCPQALMALMADPGALVVVTCPRSVDVLWGAEEALRTGCAALVIAETAEPPDLRQVRRLHLAAADGVARNHLAGRRGPAPLGLLAASETADSRIAGVESRWALHPLPPGPRGTPGTPPLLRAAGRWRLDRLLLRGQPPQDWVIDGTPLPEGGTDGVAMPAPDRADGTTEPGQAHHA